MSRQANIIATLPQGGQLFVIDNPNELSPISADGLDWYWVTWSPDGVPWGSSTSSWQDGFVAAGQDGVAYLELVPVACGTEPPTLTSIVRMTPHARSVCFAGRTLTIQGAVVSGFGGLPAPGIYDPGWLAYPFGAGHIANDDALFEYRYAPGLKLPAEPLADGTPLVVTGHFDDPASASCVIEPDTSHSSHPETAQSYCAEQFVATQVSLASP